MPETQVRELIHATGIPTFARPKGLPENYRVKPSDKPGGIKYVHSTEGSISLMLNEISSKKTLSGNEVLGQIDAEGLVVRLMDTNFQVIIKKAELFKLFGKLNLAGF